MGNDYKWIIAYGTSEDNILGVFERTYTSESLAYRSMKKIADSDVSGTRYFVLPEEEKYYLNLHSEYENDSLTAI